MFEALEALAFERAADLRLEPAVPQNALRVVTSAIGWEWLRGQEERAARPGRSIEDAHPLYRCLRSATDQSLATICELGEYLTHFANDPALSEVLKDLRSHKFDAALFELAMAYRWASAGATAVTLQPPLDTGKTADFAASLFGRRFVVEASIFPNDTFGERKYRCARVVAETAAAVSQRRWPIAVKVEVRKVTPGDFEGELKSRVKAVCTELCRKLDGGGGQCASLRDDVFELEAELITPDTEDVLDDDPIFPAGPGRLGSTKDWTVAFRLSERPVPPGVPVRKAVGRDVEMVRVFALLPEDDGSNLYERIQGKLIKEVKQLSGVREPRAVLIEVAGLASDALSLELQALRGTLPRLMRRTPELACVWLLTRGWSSYRRHQYHAVYVPNQDSIFQLPASFIRELARREWRWDFIAKCDIPLTENEESEARSEYARRAKR